MERKQRRSKTSKVKVRSKKRKEKVEEKSTFQSIFERQKKRRTKDERNEKKSLIGINGGQGNKKQEKTYINSATV